MIKNILITGSGGFVGQNLKEYFKNKFHIISPRSCELDLTNENEVQNFFETNQIDFIIHCASTGGARGIEDKNTTIEDNLKMVNNLLTNKNPATRIILFGSGAMYDKTQNITKIKEKDLKTRYPKDLYGQSKKRIAEIIKDREDTVCLNIFACYGYGEKESRLPTYAIKQNINHLPIEINQDVIFDYLFIEDLCRIVEYFIFNKPKSNIINVTPTKSIRISEIAELINEISNFKSKIIIKNQTLGKEYTGDNSILKEEFPNIEFTPIEVGLKKLYKHIQNTMIYAK